jgi:hypothetical protein
MHLWVEQCCLLATACPMLGNPPIQHLPSPRPPVRQTYVLKFQALGLGCSWLSHGGAARGRWRWGGVGALSWMKMRELKGTLASPGQ